jgi:hypothetical protein
LVAREMAIEIETLEEDDEDMVRAFEEWLYNKKVQQAFKGTIK